MIDPRLSEPSMPDSGSSQDAEILALRQAVERETRAHEHTRATLARIESAYS